MPRKELPEKQRRTVAQSIRFSPAEWSEVEKKASEAVKLPSVFIRERALGVEQAKAGKGRRKQ